MREVTFDRDNSGIRQRILMRFEQLSERIHTPGTQPLNPMAEIENLFDLLEYGASLMEEPDEVGSRVLDRPDGDMFIKVGTNAWVKVNPDTSPVFPVPWAKLLSPVPCPPEPTPSEEPPIPPEEPPPSG